MSSDESNAQAKTIIMISKNVRLVFLLMLAMTGVNFLFSVADAFLVDNAVQNAISRLIAIVCFGFACVVYFLWVITGIMLEKSSSS